MTTIVLNAAELKFSKDLTIVTHDGPFHADEVFAVALMRHCAPGAGFLVARISPRSTQEQILATVTTPSCVVIDMGGGWLDHHGPRQKECGSKSSVSLVADMLLEKGLLSERDYQRLENLFDGISRQDISGEVSSLIGETFLAKTLLGDFESFEQAALWAEAVISELLCEEPEAQPALEELEEFLKNKVGLQGQFLERLAKTLGDIRQLPGTLCLECWVKSLEYELQSQQNFNEKVERLKSLPVVEIKGHRLLKGDGTGFIPVDLKLCYKAELPGIDGIVDLDYDFKTSQPKTDWCFRCFNNTGAEIVNKGLTSEGDVIFTHASGFTGKTKTFEALSECFKD